MLHGVCLEPSVALGACLLLFLVPSVTLCISASGRLWLPEHQKLGARTPHGIRVGVHFD